MSRPRHWKVAILLVLAPAIACASATKSVSVLHKGIPISKARAALLKDGWKLVETQLKSGDIVEHDFGEAGVLYRTGFREVELCSWGGIPYCDFNYTKNGLCLKVSTRGEYIPDLHTEPKVISWSHQCPKADD